MNAWSEIMETLSKNPSLRELLIAPNAPLVVRQADGCRALTDRVFSAQDVADTLIGVVMHGPGKKADDLRQAGVVSVGVRDVGRVRVSYLAQRGSRVLRLVRIPFDVPTLDALCLEPQPARDLLPAVGRGEYKAILIHGPTQLANSSLAYALLQEINRTSRQVIYIVERSLSFLMAHDNSVVVQVELLTDVPSLEEAVRNAFLLEPDLVYLGDVAFTDVLPSLPQLISRATCTLVSAVGEEPELLIEWIAGTLRERVAARYAAVLLGVHGEPGGKLSLDITPWPLSGPTDASR
jgi:twitching motility protein PilT